MLPTSELTAMQAELKRVLSDTCTIQRRAETSDGAQSGGSRTWNNQATGVACKVAPQSATGKIGEEKPVQDVLTGITFWMATFPSGTDIQEKDRVLLTSWNPQQLFEVKSVDGPMTNEIDRRASLIKLSITESTS